MFSSIMVELISRIFDNVDIVTMIDMIGGSAPFDVTFIVWILADIFVAAESVVWLNLEKFEGREPTSNRRLR